MKKIKQPQKSSIIKRWQYIFIMNIKMSFYNVDMIPMNIINFFGWNHKVFALNVKIQQFN